MARVLPRDVLLRVGGRALDQGVLFLPGTGRGYAEVRETVTRASVGYFLDRDGIIRKAANDKIRDYWPVGAVDALGRRLHGPLSESARTNGWATVTENYADAAWTKNATTISSNVATAPDGVVLSADKLVETAPNTNHNMGRAIAGMTDNTRTSVWWLVKAVERTWCSISTLDKANVTRQTWFNLATGALGTKAAAHDAWIRPLGSSWYFVAVSFDAGTGATTPNAHLWLATADNVGAYAGDGTSGILVWESAVEVNKAYPSYPGSILPNGLARAADAATAPVNFGPTDLTAFAWFDRPLWADAGAAVDIGNFPGLLSVGNGVEPHLQMYGLQTLRQYQVAVSTVGADSFSPGAAIPAGATQTLAAQFKNLTTVSGGQAAHSSGGDYGAFGSAAAAFSAFGSQVLRIGSRIAGSEFNGVLFDLELIRGLQTHAEAFAAA